MAIGYNLRNKDSKKFGWLNPLDDNTHLSQNQRDKFTQNWMVKYDYNLINKTALRDVVNYGFNSLKIEDGNNKLLGYDFDSFSSRAYRNKKLGLLRLALGEVMDCLYQYCPVDTGFGLTHGIRYELTNSGAKIVIGRGIAEYLVHLSYPRATAENVRGESSEHRHWIDKAIQQARTLIKGYGYKLMKDHLHFGSMQLYLVSFSSGVKSINNIFRED